MTSSLLRTHIEDGVAVVTLSDPERRNALNLDMCGEIVALFDRLEADGEVGAVVLTGEPPAFCAGADLSRLGSSQRDGLELIYEGFLRVARSPLPTIAAVNGAAVGAGVNMALACDVRIAGSRARFDTRFVQLGLHPGGGHTWLMRRLVGEQGAMATVVFGEVLDGHEAERVGLVWRCVEDDELLACATELAARAASGPRELVRRVKASVQAMSLVESHDDAVQAELEQQIWSLGQPEFVERLAALQKKISKG
ncbi:MAG: putative enoyl-CoA hydratase echA14 [Acidimicrobiales bacterium]|nr:MAG: enoyl-CoA hydratase [Actinomycetota bacterium]MBV6509816.1 putative enoyl-CoA hydratase echA14 [Acidimicrobiales bacterium]RIK04415.1 MAG: enoyl-CoA hydratase [Acidobacteriota bacterium]